MIVRCFDPDVIKPILTHDSIWQHISDDACDKSTFEPVLHDSVYYLVPTLNGACAGVFFFTPHNSILYEGHYCVLPEYRGKGAIKMAQEAMLWMIKNTDCKKIIGNTPIFNKTAIRFAVLCGMTREGINRKSYQKAGAIHDQIIFGITEKELWHLQRQL